jgi:hypothetical protein
LSKIATKEKLGMERMKPKPKNKAIIVLVVLSTEMKMAQCPSARMRRKRAYYAVVGVVSFKGR